MLRAFTASRLFNVLLETDYLPEIFCNFRKAKKKNKTLFLRK